MPRIPNSICPNGGRTLVFEMACAGDVRNTLKRIDRCVEVFDRYPGLCRSMMGWVDRFFFLQRFPRTERRIARDTTA